MGFSQVRPAPQRKRVVAHFSQVHPHGNGFSQVHPGQGGYHQVAHVPDRIDPLARQYAIQRLRQNGVVPQAGQDPTAAWREFTQRNALLRFLASQQPQVGNLNQFENPVAAFTPPTPTMAGPGPFATPWIPQ